VTTWTADRSNIHATAAFGSGGTRLGLSQKDGLPIPLLEEHLAVFKAIDPR
jgi:hypothetical protein